MANPPKHPKHDDLPRYAYERITEEIETMIGRAPRGTKKRLAAALGITPSDFTHFMQGRRSKKAPDGAGQQFSLEQLGVIAHEMGVIFGKPNGAPSGWPFVHWDDAEQADAVRSAFRGSRA